MDIIQEMHESSEFCHGSFEYEENVVYTNTTGPIMLKVMKKIYI